MRVNRFFRLYCQTMAKFLMAFAALFMPLSAYAVLGGDEADLPADVAATRMELRPVDASQVRFRIHELREGVDGPRIRQFAGRNGKLFGVAWDGPVKPDLRQALGPYYDRYLATVRAAGKVRGLRQVRIDDFELRLSGHMRHFSGAAWVPSLAPNGVTLGDVR